MKLTFKTKGDVVIDYRVWLDNEEYEVEKATIKLINRHVDSVIDIQSVTETIMNNEREYLAAMLGCRPDNVEVIDCDVNCDMYAGTFNLSGTYEFEIADDLIINELPSQDDLIDNITTLVYESIHTFGDFVDDAQLRKKLDDMFYGTIDVDFYYDYKSTSCEANLEK